MAIESPTKLWPLMVSIIREFWNITESPIGDIAIRHDLPIELYLYSELGLIISRSRIFKNEIHIPTPDNLSDFLSD